MRTIGGRGGERAIVSYCFREEKGSEEEEEGFGSVMVVRNFLSSLRGVRCVRFPRDHLGYSSLRSCSCPWLRPVECVVNAGLDSTFPRHSPIRSIFGRGNIQGVLLWEQILHASMLTNVVARGIASIHVKLIGGGVGGKSWHGGHHHSNID